MPVNMAEVRLCFGRGALDRFYKLHLRESSIKRGNSLTQSSSLTSAFLSGCFTNGGLQGGDSAADRVTGAASRDSYTSGTPELGAVEDICGNGNVAEYQCCHGPEEDSLYNKTRGQITGETLPRCWSRTKLRRSFLHSQRACWGQVVFIREFGNNGTRSEPLFKTKTGYYEILEVLPSATQAQIKTAYYKQSFVFHPDRNAGSEVATVRFSEISEAYTVLGNKALRRKYDRGLLSQSDLISTARPSSSSSSKDGPGGSAAQQADSGRSVAGAYNRGGVYDFDKFFKSHYNEQLQREREMRARREDMLRDKHEAMVERKSKLMEMCVGLLVVMALGLTFSLKRG
ncbi:uncharacterized protein LOC117755870 [Hippoglossus hippoglossus]|uniref:uncharacterized protein LOC117755870 n=1 Tax=Hippoglossus hippoglossus TaxID=8267 RepID=UPI00148C2227|nr:uncharacterized protein LOC117755870 [Hippoglossus hippoglossus]